MGHPERAGGGDLPEGSRRSSQAGAHASTACCKIRGLGRIDVRLTPAGEVVVIEANPNPSLAREDDFAQAAQMAGIDYDALIQKILDAATG